ncbi:hypothetical protein C8R41DRAFT_506616 [Lentinula lateritia]|uniref:Uncharacterized protein n=1 Tax=Lentinula lateritia TaxID=40482 RepID=A0ABQ8V7N0_9AGAR|nr:hypothetical protein C8R41DRAFT_506616 [Lentinula lateritia]
MNMLGQNFSAKVCSCDIRSLRIKRHSAFVLRSISVTADIVYRDRLDISNLSNLKVLGVLDEQIGVHSLEEKKIEPIVHLQKLFNGGLITYKYDAAKKCDFSTSAPVVISTDCWLWKICLQRLPGSFHRQIPRPLPYELPTK